MRADHHAQCRRGAGLLQAIVWVVAVLALSAGACGAQAGVPQDTPDLQAEVPSGITLNFRDAPLTAVLEHLSRVAGLVIVEETAVQGRVSVMSHQPLDVEEAVSLLNTVLAEEGYAAVRKDRVLKIVTLEDAKQMSVPVRSGTDPEAIEPTDEVITQVMPLKFADAEQVREDLAPLIPSYANLSANASSNALIMTDTGANVRRIAEIVRALDTHMATVAEVRVFPLAYADAADAAALINDLFEETEAARSGPGGGFNMRRFFRGPGGRGGDESEEGVSRAPSIVAAADERTNTVVVTGPADTLRVVEGVLAQLDANPVAEESIFTYRLKNAQAANVAEVLNDLFGEVEEAAAASGGRRGRGEESQDRGPGGFFAMMRQQAAAAADGLSGKVYCVADEDTNTLLVLTAPINFERVRAIIADLDRAIPQVLIKVLLAEVTWSDTLDLGVEWSVLDVEADGDGSDVFTDFGLDEASGGLVYRLVGGDVTVALRALQEVGKLDILSRPQILTSDNQTATITVGQEVPFIRNTRTTETGQTINTIEYEDIGIILEVTPHINPDGLVIMDVAPEISTTTADTVPISEAVDAAVFAKRSAQTRIAISDRRTIVIGLLGSIPLLGALFRRTIDTKEKTELLIFLTPHVAPDVAGLEQVSAGASAEPKLMDRAIRPGTFQEHLEAMSGPAAADEE
jgi:general secretion pathway protein D